MPIEFKEYSFKSQSAHKKRKIPIIRIVLLLSLAFAAYKSGLVTDIAKSLPLFADKTEPRTPWIELCYKSSGNALEVDSIVAECSWNLKDSFDLSRLPFNFLRYIAEIRRLPNATLRWVAPQNNFSNAIYVTLQDSITDSYLHYQKKDSSYVWIFKGNGCAFPGVCPEMPLLWSALPINENFDFEDNELLLTTDVFKGIGEAPVHPVLSGVVISRGRDSLGFFIEIYHGENISSKISGLGLLDEKLSIGDSVKNESVIGRLYPKDSSMFFLTMRINGKFMRWKNFYDLTHPVTEQELLNFEKKVGI